ncbi:hypothetical protein Rt10032_c26g6806 [Rhodotorula toruloides]|uniref:Uncharacterized protein n=1 Tax=Rhodotorula toruloides TaxID=5286 RepID=A0A511KQZ9_RHOTO|nr:hypothetical protein Rt10032_c26g6806 [Rhodotorula toruloides]
MSRRVDKREYDILLRQSRLAEPPLDGLSHLSLASLANLAPPVSPQRQAVVLESVTKTISTLCTQIDAKLGDTRSLSLADSKWFHDLFSHMAREFQYLLKGPESGQHWYARAVDAKLRADVEEHMHDQSVHVRTVGGFIIQTLQELLKLLEDGKTIPFDFLWKDVVSLEYIATEMLAWAVYCADPTGTAWRNVLARRPGIEISNDRIAHVRGFSCSPSSKPGSQFQVGARRQNPGLLDQYDELLKKFTHRPN